MYRIVKKFQGTINVNKSYEGERIEQKIQRIVNNKEPISDGAPLIYQERKAGIEAQYDIRTDRWEVAVDAMDKITGTYRARREDKLKIGEQAMEGMKKENGGTEPIQATE